MISSSMKSNRLFLWGMYALLTVPLWVSAKFLFPFVTIKVLLFEALVLFLFGVWVFRVFGRPKETIEFRFSLLHIFVIVYVVIVIVSGLLGIDPARSFWGTLERGWGGFLLLNLVILFLLASQTLREEDWPKLFRFSVAVSVISAIIGYLQWQGISVFHYPVSGRVIGPIGNASLFATYLLVHLFLTGWLFERSTKSWERWFLFAAFFFQLLVLFLTETRGAIVAFFGGLGVWLLWNLFGRAPRRVRWLTVGGLAFLILLALSFWFFRASPVVSRIPALSRLATISPASDVSTQYRFLSWQAAWQGFKERPILGWGYENYYRVFDKYFPPQVFYDEGSQVWADRAHNSFVDAAVMSGIFGLFVLAGIFALAFWQSKGMPIVASLLAAYALQNLFVFEAVPSAIFFFLLLAFISQSAPIVKRVSLPRLIPVGAVFLLLFFFLVGGVRQAVASARAATVVTAAQNGEAVHKVWEKAKKALDSGGEGRFEVRQAIGDWLLVRSVGERQQIPFELRREMLGELAGAFRESIGSRPQTVRNHLYLMRLLNAFPDALPEVPKTVRALGEAALALSPTRMEIYWELGASYLNEEKPREAVPYFEKAVALYTFPPVSHWNLLYAYLKAGDEAAADREASYLEKLDFPRGKVDALYTIGVEYFWKENLSRSARFLERVYNQNPEFRDTAGYLLTIYQKSGNTEKLGRLLKGETLNLKP